MGKGDIFINDSKIDVTLPEEPDVIIFNCKKLIIKPQEVHTDWPDGFPIEFDKYQRLVFTDGKVRVTYSRIRTEEI